VQPDLTILLTYLTSVCSWLFRAHLRVASIPSIQPIKPRLQWWWQVALPDLAQQLLSDFADLLTDKSEPAWGLLSHLAPVLAWRGLIG